MFWSLALLFVGCAIAVLTIRVLRPDLAADASAPPHKGERRPSTRQSQPARPAQKAVLAPLAWVEAVRTPSPLVGDTLRARMRDRYIEARFPGLAASAADLENTDDVIRSARLCFEEKKYEQALELLHMAIEQSPGNEALRLAQLEIAFLQRRRAAFVALAAEFRAALPQSRNWAEIARLGRAVAPDDPQFAEGSGSRPHEHYGPWPDLPNWIQASWDLTAEVLAADFRRAMLRGPGTARAVPEQRIALGG
jgi:hypothetical protein